VTKRWRTPLRVAFAVLSIGALGYATVSQWSRVGDTVRDVSLPALLLGAVSMAAATYLSMLAWRAVLADLGSPLRLRYATGIFFLGQLGKYLPGSLWPVVAQMELGKEHGVPRKRSAVAALLVIVIGLTAAGVVSAATLPFVASGSLARYRYVFVVPLLGLLLLVPRVFDRVTAAGLRLLRRAPLDRHLSGRGTGAALAWSVAQWVAYGVGVWAVARGLPGAPRHLLALGVGAYALAWSAGFLFLVAPAGAGVREGALVLLLAPSLGSGPALGVALLARLLATLGDLVWGLVAFAEGGHRWYRSRGKDAVTIVTGVTADQDVQGTRRED
jgi:uncharacterized membrane protein YbhN (UPF0104 family)